MEKAQTHHKIVVLAGFGHEFWLALAHPDAHLHVAGVLTLLGFTHFTHNPADTEPQMSVL